MHSPGYNLPSFRLRYPSIHYRAPSRIHISSLLHALPHRHRHATPRHATLLQRISHLDAPLTLVVLLVHADAERCYQRHVDARRHGNAVGLLAEEKVLATEELAVDAGDDGVWVG